VTAEFERTFLSTAAPPLALPIVRQRSWNLPARAGRAIAFRVESAKMSQAQGARVHFNEVASSQKFELSARPRRPDRIPDLFT